MPAAWRDALASALKTLDSSIRLRSAESPSELNAVIQSGDVAVIVAEPDRISDELRERVLGPDCAPDAPEVFVAVTENDPQLARFEAMFRPPFRLVEVGSDAAAWRNLARQMVGAVQLQVERRRNSAALRHSEQQIGDLEEYAHTVAHNLKAPLNGIIGIARIMQEEGPDLSMAESRRYLDSIVRGGRKLDRVIEEILLLATMERQAPPRMVLDMSAIVAEALQTLEHQIKVSGAIISRPQTWPTAVGYAPWVEEVWINYLANAISYGGVPPLIQMGAENCEDGMVRFWVSDNGRGFDQQDGENLFESGTRIARPNTKGHGLGLSIVKKIVQKLDGSVRAQSCVRPGEGALFSFTLPAAQRREHYFYKYAAELRDAAELRHAAAVRAQQNEDPGT